jgi:hypothetical protein
METQDISSDSLHDLLGHIDNKSFSIVAGGFQLDVLRWNEFSKILTINLNFCMDYDIIYAKIYPEILQCIGHPTNRDFIARSIREIRVDLRSDIRAFRALTENVKYYSFHTS